MAAAAAPIVSKATNAKVKKLAVVKPTRRRPTAGQRNARTATTELGKRQTMRTEADRVRRINASQIRTAERQQTYTERDIRARKQRISSAVGTPMRKQDSYSVPNNSPVNIIMLVVFTWAGIVILYALITSPNTSSGFFNSMRTWVGLLYQTKPMFTVNETTTGA